MLDVDLISVSLEDSRHQGRATAGPVLGQQEVELVVDAHHLRNSALHHILEVGVEPRDFKKLNCRCIISFLPEQGSVDGDDNIFVVHLL